MTRSDPDRWPASAHGRVHRTDEDPIAEEPAVPIALDPAHAARGVGPSARRSPGRRPWLAQSARPRIDAVAGAVADSAAAARRPAGPVATAAPPPPPSSSGRRRPPPASRGHPARTSRSTAAATATASACRQYGARGRALAGQTHRAILAHYYRATTLGSIALDDAVRVLVLDRRSRPRQPCPCGLRPGRRPGRSTASPRRSRRTRKVTLTPTHVERDDDVEAEGHERRRRPSCATRP